MSTEPQNGRYTDMKRRFDELSTIKKSKKRISIPYDEYFGEMELTDAQKEERIGLAESIERTFLYIFGLLAVMTALDSGIDREQITSTLVTRLEDDYEQNGIDLGAYPSIREYITRRAGELIDTTIKSLDRDYDFTLSNDRAMLIGENESNSAFNSKELEDAIKNGYTQKTWRTMRDKRVRHTHEMVDGETIGIYDAFEVGDTLMLFPRDDSLGAGQEEIANCRCVVEYSRDEVE